MALEQRERLPELMDQPDLNEQVHRHALRGLGRTNSLSRVGNALWQGLVELDALYKSGSVRVLDIAAGGGDNVIRLAKLAHRRGVPLEVHGCDINPTAVSYAQSVADAAGLTGVQFFSLDAVNEPLPAGYDVVICTLFLHHLVEADALGLLRGMAAAAGKGVLVDDLVRTRWGYVLAWAGGRLFTRSPVIHTDGPLSVRAAFSMDEARGLANRAGLSGATFRRHWPERFLLVWRKP